MKIVTSTHRRISPVPHQRYDMVLSILALATLERELRGSELMAPLEAPPQAFLFHFRRHDGDDCIVGWSVARELEVSLPRPAVRVVQQSGESLPMAGIRAVLTSSVRYFHLEASVSR